MGDRKLQSAMEYLMTYGWAILIIAVVLGALFALGLLTGGQTGGTACLAQPGYSCSNPILSTGGNLSFSIGVAAGTPTLYNVEIGCAATQSSSGLPNPGNAMVIMFANGFMSNTVTASYAPTGGTINSILGGQTISVQGLHCYNAAGNTLAYNPGFVPGWITGGTATLPATANTVALGTSYTGIIFVNYTTGNSAPGSSNPWNYAKVATVKASVSRTGS